MKPTVTVKQWSLLIGWALSNFGMMALFAKNNSIPGLMLLLCAVLLARPAFLSFQKTAPTR